MSEALVSRAETLAWDYGLGGYDAVQVASALTWQASIGQDVFLGTFDGELWKAAPVAGLHVWPEKLAKIGYSNLRRVLCRSTWLASRCRDGRRHPDEEFRISSVARFGRSGTIQGAMIPDRYA